MTARAPAAFAVVVELHALARHPTDHPRLAPVGGEQLDRSPPARVVDDVGLPEPPGPGEPSRQLGENVFIEWSGRPRDRHGYIVTCIFYKVNRKAQV